MALKVVGSNPIIHPIKNAEAKASVFFMAIMGFERPLRKQSGGLFLGRGRIPVQLTASGQDVGSCAALLQNCTRLDTFFKSDIL